MSNHIARVELAVELRYGQKLELPRTSRQTATEAETSRPAGPTPSGVDVDVDGATLSAQAGAANDR